jgi:hypothetical protein
MTMPMADLLIVAAIVVAFTLFAIVLAWGNHYERSGSRPVQADEGTSQGARIIPLDPQAARAGCTGNHDDHACTGECQIRKQTAAA